MKKTIAVAIRLGIVLAGGALFVGSENVDSAADRLVEGELLHTGMRVNGTPLSAPA